MAGIKSLKGDRSLRGDIQAGLVLGIQSVPDGLATGVLAGLNPMNGLYAYIVGSAAGAAFTSSTMMVVQATGAMAMVISDVPAVHGGNDQARALATLSLLTGVVMLIAGFLKLGSLLRFVSNAVLVGFMSAVGVNIILGQVANLTGYAAPGDNRVIRTVNTILSPTSIHWQSLIIGLATIALIVLLEHTPIGSFGLVVAVVVTSVLVPILGWTDVATLHDLGFQVTAAIQWTLPSIAHVPALLVPAASLAFIALVQGAGISAMYAKADGQRPDVSRDFIGQGVANAATALTAGMPVGGSASASALNAAAGAKTRRAPMIAALVMILVVIVFGSAVDYLAMPALAGLLILVGYRTIRPADIQSVWKAGNVQKAVLVVTFALTMFVPLQYAVLVGVGVSVVLHVVQQSNQVTVRRRMKNEAGDTIEVDPPKEVPAGEVVVLQPYGSLFFASAPVFEEALPAITATSTGSVVIIRLRGRVELGTTFVDVLARYAVELEAAGSRLFIVSVASGVMRQLKTGGVLDAVGDDGIFLGDERVGAALVQAESAAEVWIAQQPPR